MLCRLTDLTYSKALLLGAGFVVKPTLTLLSDKGVEVTVGEHGRFLIDIAMIDCQQHVER